MTRQRKPLWINIGGQPAAAAARKCLLQKGNDRLLIVFAGFRPHTGYMREGGRVRQWLRRLRAARREGAWLGASLVVAAATIVSVLAFGSYESGHREAALNAEAAQLAASKARTILRIFPSPVKAPMPGSSIRDQCTPQKGGRGAGFHPAGRFLIGC